MCRSIFAPGWSAWIVPAAGVSAPLTPTRDARTAIRKIRTASLRRLITQTISQSRAARQGRIVERSRFRTHQHIKKERMPGPQTPADPPVKALRLHGTIARKLGIAIVSGQYAPGDLLDSEIAASEQFAVSRTAYREAVRILAAKGLVDARPKVGTRVNPQSKWALLDPDVLEWTFESEPDLILLNSLFELRNVVESAAAGLAALRRTAAQLEAMRVALDAMAANTLATPEGRQADLDFHTTLLNATNNPFIISLTSGVSAAISTTTIFKQRKRPLRRDPMPDHLKVFTAIAAKDAAKAQKAMSELIELARMDTPSSRKGDKRRA
ncbi:MAG: FadR family transcriptional regulator [Proteobacteria bacterium]|nr:FadR family transcriptional regulator [Pseudomonadota bacterium]